MKEKKSYQVYRTIMIIALTAFITFLITTIIGYNYITNGNGKLMLLGTDVEEEDISTLLQTYKELINKYYLGEVNEEDLKEGAIRGYIEGLGDPYTEYISKEEMEEYMQDTLGNYVGIGIYMTTNTKNGHIVILATMKGSPAETAGLKPGDEIIKVDDEDCTTKNSTEVSNKIKGEEGTTVKLEVLRDDETLNFEVKRENIKVNPVEGKVISDNIGYIKFTSFDETTAEDFKNTYEDLSKQNIKSLIIDLRNNGGGLVDQAVDIADYFLEKGQVVIYEVDKNGNEEAEISENNPIINMPVVILTNENTASASEILAGSLKDYGKATIVGTTTYGKGVIQQILTFKDGSGLKITTEEYQTPNHNKINKIGIEPDEVVELPDTVENKLDVPEEQDTQLQKAIEILKNK